MVVNKYYPKTLEFAIITENHVEKAHIAGVNTLQIYIKAVSGELLNGEKVLVIWRELAGNVMADDFMLNEYFNSIPREQWTHIYVNGDNTLMNSRKPDDQWNVYLTEIVFKEKMFDVKDV